MDQILAPTTSGNETPKNGKKKMRPLPPGANKQPKSLGAAYKAIKKANAQQPEGSQPYNFLVNAKIHIQKLLKTIRDFIVSKFMDDESDVPKNITRHKKYRGENDSATDVRLVSYAEKSEFSADQGGEHSVLPARSVPALVTATTSTTQKTYSLVIDEKLINSLQNILERRRRYSAESAIAEEPKQMTSVTTSTPVDEDQSQTTTISAINRMGNHDKNKKTELLRIIQKTFDRQLDIFEQLLRNGSNVRNNNSITSAMIVEMTPVQSTQLAQTPTNKSLSISKGKKIVKNKPVINPAEEKRRLVDDAVDKFVNNLLEHILTQLNHTVQRNNQNLTEIKEFETTVTRAPPHRLHNNSDNKLKGGDTGNAKLSTFQPEIPCECQHVSEDGAAVTMLFAPREEAQITSPEEIVAPQCPLSSTMQPLYFPTMTEQKRRP